MGLSHDNNYPEQLLATTWHETDNLRALDVVLHIADGSAAQAVSPNLFYQGEANQSKQSEPNVGTTTHEFNVNASHIVLEFSLDSTLAVRRGRPTLHELADLLLSCPATMARLALGKRVGSSSE